MKITALIAICLSFFCLVNLAWGEMDIQEVKRLAEIGDGEAQNDLGSMYYHGIGVPQNFTEAMKWFKKAADQGLDEAQNNLGLMYLNGEGVPQNNAEAMKWFKKAADQGHAEAQNNLGGMYYDGKGVPQNLINAYVWLSIASANGHEFSKENLEMLRSQMTPQQIAQAQKEAAELWKRINK